MNWVNDLMKMQKVKWAATQLTIHSKSEMSSYKLNNSFSPTQPCSLPFTLELGLDHAHMACWRTSDTRWRGGMKHNLTTHNSNILQAHLKKSHFSWQAENLGNKSIGWILSFTAQEWKLRVTLQWPNMTQKVEWWSRCYPLQVQWKPFHKTTQ